VLRSIFHASAAGQHTPQRERATHAAACAGNSGAQARTAPKRGPATSEKRRRLPGFTTRSSIRQQNLSQLSHVPNFSTKLPVTCLKQAVRKNFMSQMSHVPNKQPAKNVCLKCRMSQTFHPKHLSHVPNQEQAKTPVQSSQNLNQTTSKNTCPKSQHQKCPIFYLPCVI